MLPYARVAVILSFAVQLGVAALDTGWQKDGYHVFPGGSIQEALDATARNATNKVVKVHAGVYRPDAKRQALIWLNRAHEGILLEAVGDVTLTAANPELSDAKNPSYPAVVNHVVYFGDGISSRTILRGFKITGANHFVTREAPEIEPNQDLKRSLFFYADGGAVKIFGHSYPTLQRLEIVDNYASPCAGGISVQHDASRAGSGTKTVRIENCIFRRNRSQITGAAVDLLPGSSAVISNCLFASNIANLGVNYISDNPAQPEFTNSAPLTVFPTSRAVVLNCTFIGNRNGVEDLSGDGEYRDCIFWQNTLGGAFYGGQRYELCLTDGARVIGCAFGGPVLDVRGSVSHTENRFDSPDPKFDARFNPRLPACNGIGFHIATN
jgi:hypothetical protein